MDLPAPVDDLADELAACPGVVAVVVGGSRATGDADGTSDWDLGVYYRGTPDLAALAGYGEVHPPGTWGRLMNGGAWLTLGGTKVDVLLRDLDVVEHWATQAHDGRYEVDAVLGYVAGLPTYSLAAEASVARVVRSGFSLDTTYPDALASTGAWRWRIHRDFALRYAAMHATRGNAVGVLGQLARAVLEEAHARRCEARRWALNEKRLLDGCALDDAAARLAAGARDDDLAALVDAVATATTSSWRSPS